MAIEPDDTAPRRRRQQARSLETKKKILTAAAQEFALNGYEGASTRTVAKKAGVKHPMVTYHYQTKMGLWQAVLTYLNELWDDRYNARREGLRGVDDVTILRLLLEEFIYFGGQNPEFHWLMSDATRERTERLDWLLEQFVRPKVENITRLIALAQKKKRFVEGDPAHLFYLFIGAATRIFMVNAELEALTGVTAAGDDFIKRHADLCLGLFFRDAPSRGR